MSRNLASKRTRWTGTKRRWIDASGDITVEEFLERQCAEIMSDVQAHAKGLIAQLKEEYATGRKANRGAHDAQHRHFHQAMFEFEDCSWVNIWGKNFDWRFPLARLRRCSRWEGPPVKCTEREESACTKDKEVSTAHARIEIRNGQAFYVDTHSTNGSSINGQMIEVNTPLRLNDGDVVGIGGSEVSVTITSSSEEVESSHRYSEGDM